MTSFKIWWLFLIFITPDGTEEVHKWKTPFATMEECFEKREKDVAQLGLPYENNYQLVCVTQTVEGTGT